MRASIIVGVMDDNGTQIGMSECSSCVAGRYSSMDEATNCTICSAGSSSVSGSSTCVTCTIGRYALAGDTTCHNCSLGYRVDALATACEACQPSTAGTRSPVSISWPILDLYQPFAGSMMT